jgi:serine/threonine protein kinase
VAHLAMVWMVELFRGQFNVFEDRIAWFFYLFAGYSWFGPFSYHMVYRFPRELPQGKFWSALKWFLYAIGAILFVHSLVFDTMTQTSLAVSFNFKYYHVDSFMSQVYYWFWIGSLVSTSAALVRNNILVKEPEQRRRAKLVLYGTLIGVIPQTALGLFQRISESAGYMALTAGDLFRTLWWFSDLAVLLVPISLGYAILKRQVYDINIAVRRGLQYLLAKNALRALLAAPMIGLAITIYANRDRTLTDLLFRNSIWFYASLLAAIALGLAYRRKLRDWLDRRFFREAYQQDKILRELIEEVRQLDSMADVARLVSQKVDAALHPERLYLFYREEGRRDLALGYSSGGASQDLRIPAEFELLGFMEYQGRAQDFPFPARTKLPPREKEWLANLGASLIVPMRGTDDRLAGLLALGPKKSETPYSGSDRQLLETLADQIALVYENARLKERAAKDRRIQHEVLARVEERQINLLKECPQCGACYNSAARVCAKDQTELELTLPVERTLEEKYRLEQLLGKGGMGAVYAATDLRLRRRVAVKVMTGSLFGDQAALRRFEREARASARLNHPNIIAVHDYGRAGAEGAYLVMELVAGVTLRDELKSAGRLASAAAAEWFAQILIGIQAAHEAGVIHRDLKPENILLTGQVGGRREIKILDFGLAKLRRLNVNDSESAAGQGDLTTPGTVMGTFGYMSPEQLLGEEADERSDIFALGVMVVEALTGRRPFEGRTHAELLTAILQKPFHLPGETPPLQRLGAALQKCLAKDRQYRYASVAKMRDELIPAINACSSLPAANDFTDVADTTVLSADGGMGNSRRNRFEDPMTF